MVARSPPVAALPWRSDDGRAAPAGLPLPGPSEMPWRATAMPAWRHRRPLKRWRYVGVYSADLMLCVGDVHIGPARQTFWAVWDRARGELHERTHLRSHDAVCLNAGRMSIHEPSRGIDIDLSLDEDEGLASVCTHGRNSYVWTRKQGGVAVRGRIALPDASWNGLEARAIIDDTAGYHARRTDWLWSAGVGVADDGSPVAWNLVSGVNDPPSGSERSIWIDGVAGEPGPVRFAADLGAVRFADGAELLFAAETTRSRHDNLLFLRSDYEQPFGTFSGSLPGGLPLREGFGVMERHSARW
jgi:Protein of unknown function (DUF2804)